MRLCLTRVKASFCCKQKVKTGVFTLILVNQNQHLPLLFLYNDAKFPTQQSHFLQDFVAYQDYILFLLLQNMQTFALQ